MTHKQFSLVRYCAAIIVPILGSFMITALIADQAYSKTAFQVGHMTLGLPNMLTVHLVAAEMVRSVATFVSACAVMCWSAFMLDRFRKHLLIWVEIISVLFVVTMVAATGAFYVLVNISHVALPTMLDRISGNDVLELVGRCLLFSGVIAGSCFLGWRLSLHSLKIIIGGWIGLTVTSVSMDMLAYIMRG